MKHRKLRIAWSMAWGTLAVLLIALWVRSHYHTDKIWRINSVVETGVESATGTLTCWQKEPISSVRFPWHHDKSNPVTFLSRFVYVHTATVFAITCPTWLPLVAVSILGAVPWVRRFTLRTLLISMTFVSAALGLIVWAEK